MTQGLDGAGLGVPPWPGGQWLSLHLPQRPLRSALLAGALDAGDEHVHGGGHRDLRKEHVAPRGAGVAGAQQVLGALQEAVVPPAAQAAQRQDGQHVLPPAETRALVGDPAPPGSPQAPGEGNPCWGWSERGGGGAGAGQRSWRSWLAVEGPAGGEKGPPAGVQETLGWGGAREEGCVCRGRRARSITGLGKEGRPESTVPGAQPGSRWRRGVEEALLVTPSRPGHPASRSLGGQGP